VSGGDKDILPVRKVEPWFFGCPARSLLAGPTGLSRVGVSVRTHSSERHIVLREVSYSHDSKHEDNAVWCGWKLSTFRRYILPSECSSETFACLFYEDTWRNILEAVTLLYGISDGSCLRFKENVRGRLLKLALKVVCRSYDEWLNVVETHWLIRRPSKRIVAAKQQFVNNRLHVSAHQALYPIKHDDGPQHLACCKWDMCCNQWRTQEFFFGGGGVQQIQLRTENGVLGAAAP
jgi:hypothetical protein